ncbi:MAG: hypothetical protein HYY44_00475 [Deltaproteobacteria bacterium]|nr:hypothetical protein [Deltaproteobacteria bacterium]
MILPILFGKQLNLYAGNPGKISELEFLSKKISRSPPVLAELIQVGLRIGADLPFFLVEGPQRVTGIGEILEPISVPSLPIILINPGFPVSTKEAYRWFDATVDDEVAAGLLKSALPGAAGPSGVPADNENSRFVREGSLAAGALKVVAEAPDDEKSLAATSRIRAGLTEIKTDAIPPLLENDLEEVVISRYPVLAEVKETLVKAGALGALMSGSGGTVFGLFESAASRDRGFDLIVSKKDPNWWLWKGNARG